MDPTVQASAIAVAAVVVVCAYVRNLSTSFNALGLTSELCAWMLILSALHIKQSYIKTSTIETGLTVTNPLVLAVCIVLAYICEQSAPVETMTPFLGPCILAVSRIVPHVNKLAGILPEDIPIGWYRPHFVYFVVGLTAAITLVRVYIWGGWVITGVLHLLLCIPLFGTFGRRRSSKYDEVVSVDIAMEQVAVRVIVLLSVCIALTFMQNSLGVFTFSVTGVLWRAAFWGMLLAMKQTGHAAAIPAIYSIGVMLAYITDTSSSTIATFLCLLCIMTVWLPYSGLTASSEPRTVFTTSSTARSLTVLLSVYTIGILLSQLDWSTPPQLPPELRIPLARHPIAELAEAAVVKAAAIERGQSKTLDLAVRQYKHDYGHAPPPGFDGWFAYAQQQGALIDSYQTMTRSIHAMHRFSPAFLRKAMLETVQNGASFSVLFQIRSRNTTAASYPDHWWTKTVLDWLPYPVPEFLPEMDFAVSLYDEPRILLQQEAVASQIAGGPVEFNDYGRQDNSAIVEKSCPPGLQQNRPFFIENTTLAMDACLDRSLLGKHGLFVSPESLRPTHQVTPLISSARTSPYFDILGPSAWYQTMHNLKDYKESWDSTWEKKKDVLHWAGRSTGGHATSDNWWLLHRQRFVHEANNGTRQIRVLSRMPSQHIKSLGEDDAPWRWEMSTMNRAGVSDLISARLASKPVQCEQDACAVEYKHFDMGSWASEKKSHNAKLVIDIDGNGYSGRFLRLLSQNSTVLKQTIFQEWHDDRLVPWAHYIPISMAADELPEIVRYLLTEDEGRVIAKRIAEEGSRWAKLTMRSEDLKVAFLRLLIEYAWLLSDDRVVSGS